VSRRVGVIGSGHICAAVAGLLAAAGHDVALANSRGPASLADLAAEIGARAETIEGAARHGDVVLLAIPFGAYERLPAEPFTGKVVIDAGNYFPNRDGHVQALDDGTTTSSELLAAHLPGARVVKAFNTLNWQHLRDRADDPERIAIFMAGDDPDAKDRVAALIGDIGFAAVDAGGLAEGGRKQQIGGPLAGLVLTGSEAAARV
jgi:8-hydroxy-5-deazaflavin:NADPH oxidoreductase